MGLSRLDNFLKSIRGTILYVNPNDLDATDSIDNQGNSLTRPFKTIQRALAEASRFSYQRGLNNDRFNKTTILVYPGDHVVDNRPGWIPDGANNFRLRNGLSSSDFSSWDSDTNFNVESEDNALYKLNSIYGGVIVPRGTSIVGLDLRKTKIRPKYVPSPTNDNIERSTIFRVTGGCYFWQLSLFDADPNGTCYIDYTSNTFVPNFSHHKLTCFQYADGKNNVQIKDEFYPTGLTYDRTDLDMYYEKVGLCYGSSSGRAIEPDYPSAGVDIQPKIDEYRIVGSTGLSVGISSIRAGNGVTPTTSITVTTVSAVPGLDVDTPFRIEGISATGYNGQFVVSERTSDTQVIYQVQNAPSNPLPSVSGATLSLSSDTVTSASPYIFNISLRSVYGMCGVLADGAKADGFKSMLIAQFTGIGLQKDDNAFVVYDDTSGSYQDSTVAGNETISTNSRALFKPEYGNFHIKAINDAFIQNVSIFAIGYAEQFVVESGGDMSITNSNSNFGAKALVADGFRTNAFPQDDLGYITHIIPPKEISVAQKTIEFNSIDVNRTVGVASTGHLYLYAQTNIDSPPENVIDGYRFGAKESDTINVLISTGSTTTEYSSRVVMPNSQNSSEKSFNVVSRASNTLTFSSAHTFINGESIRILSADGSLPDGILSNKVYYAIVGATGIGSTQIRVSQTQTDALSYSTSNLTNISFNTRGGPLKVVSRVSDKNSGDIGHPIQYDTTNSQWYVKVSTSATDNSIYSTVVGLGSTSLGNATSRTYIKRTSDDRNTSDVIYRVRYVMPAQSGGAYARPPSDGFIIQESNTSIGSTESEIQSYFGEDGTVITNENQLRNPRFIASASWSGGTANVVTELPHNLSIGSHVEIVNVISSNNPTGVGNSGFNGTYAVSGISSAKQFSVGITTNPGTFTDTTSIRSTSLPYFKRKRYSNTYYVYRTQEVQPYISGQQDGIYYLTVLNASNSPAVAPFTSEKYSQPVKELYPQTNRDNPISDPKESISYANPTPVGEVIVNDVRNSLTKETITKILKDTDVGVGITNIVSTSTTSHVIHTSIDHGFNRVMKVGVTSTGVNYGVGTGSTEVYYNAQLVGFAGSTTGQHATAKVTLSSTGSISEIHIMDGGSSYGIGNTLSVVGIATTTGHVPGYVTVTQIYNNIGDTVRVSGVSSETTQVYNTLYRITDVPVGLAKSFSAISDSAIGIATVSGITSSVLTGSFVYPTGESIAISSLVYNNVSGIATITTSNRHGLRVNNKVRITGANQSQYNGSFVVNENISLTSFSVIIGVGTTAPSATGTLFAYREGVTSNGGSITVEDENIGGRMVHQYAGITTTLGALVPDAITDELYVRNIQNLDIKIGDYLQVDDEIVRVKRKVPVNIISGDPIYVFRGAGGTKADTHVNNSVVRRINVNPVELRRHSIIRASAHTFEYVGFGPGNYSTALPEKQDRQISDQEELLGQSTRREAGINFYTGMNHKGISYSGNKKLSTVTGQEEIFDTPVQTVTGEDIGNRKGINVINPLEVIATRSIQVEGDSDGKATSQFNGPVIFTNKLTSTSEKGIEASSLYLQGDATVSRKYTVGVSVPTLSGNPGDVAYYSDPSEGDHAGWIYTVENSWRIFGPISLTSNSNTYVFDSVGVGTTTPGNLTFRVGSGSSQFSVDSTGVGIGTTSSGYKLNVNGTTNLSGAVSIGGSVTTSDIFYGDGSGLNNLNVTATGWVVVSNGIYNTNPTTKNVGIGTTNPTGAKLIVGATGSTGSSLIVNGLSIFNGITTFTGATNVTAKFTSTNFRLDNPTPSGSIRAGIITTGILSVGAGGTIFNTFGASAGVGTFTPRAKLDVEGHSRLKTFAQPLIPAASVSNVVSLNLSEASFFEHTLVQNVSSFTLISTPSGAPVYSFTLKITQGSTGNFTANLDNFQTATGTPIPIYWPAGGVIPIITPVVGRTDIYSFTSYDGGLSYYAVVVGQNFT